MIPLLTWFLLAWIWKDLKPDAESEERCARAFLGVLAGVLLKMAISDANSEYHIGNTMTIRTRDGYEDVGDDVVLPGPNIGGAMVWGILAAFALGKSIVKWELKKQSPSD